jgi:hypothetical protein
MARKRAAAKKTEKQEPTLVWEAGYWWIVDGKSRENAGRSRRYAEKLLAERTQ